MSPAMETRENSGILNILQWNVQNFRSFVTLSREVRTTVSPYFVGKSTSLPNTLWRIVVQLPEELTTDNVNEKFVQVYLYSKMGNPSLNARAQLSLLNGDQGEIYTSQLWEGTFEGRDSPSGELETLKIASSSNFSKIPYVFAFLDENLRLKVKLWIKGIKIEAVIPGKVPQSQAVSNNILQLMASPSDVTIVAEETTFFMAHKNILSSRSPVFAAMFRNPMSESLTNNNTVNIEEFSSRTVRGMLEFIYGGSVEEFKDDFMELLKIANKYQLEALKTECINTAISKISVENVFQLLILGDLYNAPELKSKAMNFINSNKGNSLFSLGNKNAAFKEFAKDHPNLVLEIYENLRNNYTLDKYSEESEYNIIQETITSTYNT